MNAGPPPLRELLGVARRGDPVGSCRAGWTGTCTVQRSVNGSPSGMARVLVGRRVELVQVLDVVREVGDRAVVEVVAGLGVGQLGRGVADERDDRGRAGRVGLLVHEAHGHRGVGVDPGRELEAVLVGHRARQAGLHELEARRLEAEQPVEVGRGHAARRSGCCCPAATAATAARLVSESLRSWNSTSLVSITHVDVEPVLGDAGDDARSGRRPAPPTTSVGDGSRLDQHGAASGPDSDRRHVGGSPAPAAAG